MTPADARAMYRALIAENGEPITLRRVNLLPTAPNEVTVRARITTFEPEEMVGPITTADRKIIVLAEDLEGTSYPIPLTKNDKLVIRSKVYTISEVDDETRRVAGVLIAYEITARA